MKINTFLSMAALAGVAAVAVFASCSRQKEIEAPPQDELPVTGVHTVVFNALQGSTRAQFGELENGQWPTLWTDNDSELKLSLNYGGAQTATVSPSEDYRSATFSAEIDFTGTASPYTYYAISPSSAAKALSPSREAWKITMRADAYRRLRGRGCYYHCCVQRQLQRLAGRRQRGSAVRASYRLRTDLA